jgi:23S rRNA pseudouridine1911/1915/1917 synthase
VGAEILYCDNHLLVCNKPAGMLTQPNHTDAPSVEEYGKGWVKERFQKSGAIFLHALHRLDRPVSGIVLFARTSKALSRLNTSIREGTFQKEYQALVEGRVKEEEGLLEHHLQRDPFCSRVVQKESVHAKKCLLKYHMIKGFDRYTLLKISLITGRYHQIRAQLSAVGHPILGDQKYGSLYPSPHLFLHHGSLRFPHPVTGHEMHFEAPLPSFWPSFDRFFF